MPIGNLQHNNGASMRNDIGGLQLIGGVQPLSGVQPLRGMGRCPEMVKLQTIHSSHANRFQR